MTEEEKQTKTANTFFTPKGTFKLCTKSLELGAAVQVCDPGLRRQRREDPLQL